jgi:hypothetical protein
MVRCMDEGLSVRTIFSSQNHDSARILVFLHFTWMNTTKGNRLTGRHGIGSGSMITAQHTKCWPQVHEKEGFLKDVDRLAERHRIGCTVPSVG